MMCNKADTCGGLIAFKGEDFTRIWCERFAAVPVSITFVIQVASATMRCT